MRNRKPLARNRSRAVSVLGSYNTFDALAGFWKCQRRGAKLRYVVLDVQACIEIQSERTAGLMGLS